MFTALCVVAVLAMAVAPFYMRWRYREDCHHPPQEYPRIYYVLLVVGGEALLAFVLNVGIASAAAFDFHRGMPPFPAPIIDAMAVLDAAFITIALVCLVPCVVIMFRSPGSRQKR